MAGYSEGDFDPISADVYDAVATWGGKRLPASTAYQIRFLLTSAKLYHYTITASASQTVQVTVPAAVSSTPAAAASHGVGGGTSGFFPPVSRASSSAASSNPLPRQSFRSPCGFLVFADVPEHAWFAPYIHALADDGIVCGYRDSSGQPTGVFRPGNPVSAAEVVKMVLLASGKALDPRSPANLSARGDWSAPYVRTAEDLHLSVYTPSLIVQHPATRGEVIQTLLEAFSIPLQTNVPNPFSDLPPSDPHAAAILTAAHLGILSGDDGKATVRPDDPVNRAEAAKIVMSVLPIPTEEGASSQNTSQ